jgi:DNA replication protein DnaC
MSDDYTWLKEVLKTLKISSVGITDEIIDKTKGAAENIKVVLERAAELRTDRSLGTRSRLAGLIPEKTLDTFTVNDKILPNLSADLIGRLATCEFINDAKDVVAFGNNGTGKSHLAKAIGREALRRSWTVRFYNYRHLICEMTQADENGQFIDLLKRLHRARLLIIDEFLSYRIEGRSAELLFELVNKRSECRSTYYTTNHSEPEWAALLGDGQTAKSIISRIRNQAFALNMNSKTNYRAANAQYLKQGEKPGGGD